jgi:hypothetical protein
MPSFLEPQRGYGVAGSEFALRRANTSRHLHGATSGALPTFLNEQPCKAAEPTVLSLDLVAFERSDAWLQVSLGFKR